MSWHLASNAKAAKEARERATEYADAMRNAGVDTFDLVGRVDSLVASLGHLAPEMEDAGDGVEAVVGQMAFLQSQLAAGGALRDFEALGLTAEEVAEAFDTGKKDIGRFNTILSVAKHDVGQARTAMMKLEGPIQDVGLAILDAAEAGEIELDNLDDLGKALSDSADARIDALWSLENESEAFLNAADSQRVFIGALGDGILKEIESRRETESNIDILSDLERRLEAVVEAEEAHQKAVEEATGADGKFLNVIEDLVPSLEDFATAEAEAAAEAAALKEEIDAEIEAFDKLVASVQSATDHVFVMSDLQDALAQSSRDLFDALLESETGMLGIGEAAEAARSAAGDFADKFDDLLAGMVQQKDSPEDMAEAFFTMREAMLQVAEDAGKSEEEIRMLIEAIDAIPSQMDTDVRVRIWADTVNVSSGLTNQLTSELNNILNSTGMLGANFGFGATGGIVTQPTMALIGEAGPEAVVPLSQMPGASPLGGVGGGGGTTTINITVNGVSGEDVVNAIQNETRNRGTALFPSNGSLRN